MYTRRRKGGGNNPSVDDNDDDDKNQNNNKNNNDENDQEQLATTTTRRTRTRTTSTSSHTSWWSSQYVFRFLFFVSILILIATISTTTTTTTTFLWNTFETSTGLDLSSSLSLSSFVIFGLLLVTVIGLLLFLVMANCNAPTRRESVLILLFLLVVNLQNQTNQFILPPIWVSYNNINNNVDDDGGVVVKGMAMQATTATTSQDNNMNKDQDSSSSFPFSSSLSSSSSLIIQPKPTSRGLYQNTKHNNIVHVIHTRFLQHQRDLKHLAKARLQLFQTFTLPSIIQQTNHDFLWIIWFDSYLNDEIRNEFLHVLQQAQNKLQQQYNNSTTTTTTTTQSQQQQQPFVPQLNVLVLGSRAKLPSLRSDFYNSHELTASSIYHGQRSMILDYKEAAETRIVLETILDADDAIFYDFVETIQTEASLTLAQSTIQSDYRYWCAPKILVWSYYGPKLGKNNNHHHHHHHMIGTTGGTGGTTGGTGDIMMTTTTPGSNNNNNNTSTTTTTTTTTTSWHNQGQWITWNYGGTTSSSYQKTCPTGGFTTGYGIGTTPNDLPNIPRHELHLKTAPCEFAKYKCWSRFHAGSAEYSILRTTTPMAVNVAQAYKLKTSSTIPSSTSSTSTTNTNRTTTTTPNVATTTDFTIWQTKQDDIWNKAAINFGIQKQQVIDIRSELESNMFAIILDGMQGICTPGHSCKRDDKEALRKLKLWYKYPERRGEWEQQHENINNHNNNNAKNEKNGDETTTTTTATTTKEMTRNAKSSTTTTTPASSDRYNNNNQQEQQQEQQQPTSTQSTISQQQQHSIVTMQEAMTTAPTTTVKEGIGGGEPAAEVVAGTTTTTTTTAVVIPSVGT